MTHDEPHRLIAWSAELRAVHQRLRDALALTRAEVAAGHDAGPVTRELLLYCHGFCAALDGHHAAEDRTLFPAIEAAHPELAETLGLLQRDHSMIGHLVGALQEAVDRSEGLDVLDRHLEGIEAVMESHFGYEERQLLRVLDALALPSDPADALGPL